MDINVTLVGVVILLTIFIPIGYMVLISSGSIKKAKKSIVELSKSQGANPQMVEVIGNAVIGLDNVSKKLVYTQKQNPETHFKVIEINDLKNVYARSTRFNDKSLSWVGLELVGKTKKYEIPFYIDNAEDGHSRDPEVCLQDAKKWEHTIRPLLQA